MASARNHVKENTLFSQMASKTPITDIKVLSIRYIHLYIYIYIYIYIAVGRAHEVCCII